MSLSKDFLRHFGSNFIAYAQSRLSPWPQVAHQICAVGNLGVDRFFLQYKFSYTPNIIKDCAGAHRLLMYLILNRMPRS